MITIRQIERLFNDQHYPRLYRELIANRPEVASFCNAAHGGPSRFAAHTDAMSDNVRKCPTMSDPAQDAFAPRLARPVPLAALAMIRLDELTQAHHPLYRRFLNVVLTGQEKDGGWGDPLVTALCLRALLCGEGQGPAVHGALAYLSNMQKPEGIWPAEPLRRLPADGLVSAFILYQLGKYEIFRRAIRFDDAIQWFLHHAGELDSKAHRIWDHAKLRCRVRAQSPMQATLWTAPRPAA